MRLISFILIYCHFVPTFARFIDAPFGLVIDFLLVITTIYFVQSKGNIETPTNRDIKPSLLYILLSIWFAYIIFELFNPEAKSLKAWFYAMRAMALYGWLIAFIGVKSDLKKADLVRYFHVWLLVAVVGGLYGIRMEIFGPLPFEKQWLAEGAYLRHILWGKLRVFSFYTDASTYGNAMGQAFVASSVLFLGPFSRKTKFKLLFCSLITLVGMSLSGTRGAYAVPGAGLLIFVLITKSASLRLVVFGSMIAVFALLKFTYVGQSVYSIQRMRSSLDASDPSLQVRLINRELLTKYLSDKPFGGGVGSSGLWGRRFSPNTYLANFFADGGYTLIRAECGVIGKWLYIFIHLFILLRGVRFLIKTEDQKIFYYGAAIVCGFAGLMLSNYGNSTLAQLPNSMVTLFGLMFLEKMQQGLIVGEEPSESDETDPNLEIES